MKLGRLVLRGTLTSALVVTASLSLAHAQSPTGNPGDGPSHPGWAQAPLDAAVKHAGLARAEADKAKAAAANAKAAQEKKDGKAAQEAADAAKAAYEASFSNYQEASAHVGLCDGQARGCWPTCADKVAACDAQMKAALTAANEARDFAFEALKQATRATSGVTNVDISAAESGATKTAVAELRSLADKEGEELKKNAEIATKSMEELAKTMAANDEMAPSLKKKTTATIKTFTDGLAQLDKLTNRVKRVVVGALDDEDAGNLKRLTIAARATPTLVADFKASIVKETAGATAKFDADLSQAGIGEGAAQFKAVKDAFEQVALHGERIVTSAAPVATPSVAKMLKEKLTTDFTKLVTDTKESLLKLVEFIGKMKDQQAGEEGDTPPEGDAAATASGEAPAEASAEAPAEASAEAPAEAPAEAAAEEAPAEAAEGDAPPEEKAEGAEAAPAEEAPAEEAPAAEAPAEDAPAEDAPAEDAPAEDAPAEEAPAEEKAEE